MKRTAKLLLLLVLAAVPAAAQKLEKTNPQGLSKPATYTQLADPAYKVEIEAIAVLPS